MSGIDRRGFLRLGVAAAATGLAGKRVLAKKPLPPPDGAQVKTAGIKLIRVDGKYNVWTKRVGSGRIKMLTLHGGPGCTHEYFECFEDFLPQAGIEFFYYDQLGSAYSDQPDDPSLWTVDRFREASIEADGVIRRVAPGSTPEQIVEVAQETDASLIVMGTRGMTEWKSLLLGGVANKVVQHAPCPVLLVR